MSILIFGGRIGYQGKRIEMSVLSAFLERLFGGKIADKLGKMAETFAKLGKLTDIAVIPCSSSPIEYARRRENRNVTAELFRALSARYRARLYRLRFFPCCHIAGGVMIRKKGRLVRRKR